MWFLVSKMMEKLLIRMPLFKWRVTKGYNNSPFKYKPAQYLGGVYFPQKGMVELAHLMSGGGPAFIFGSNLPIFWVHA